MTSTSSHRRQFLVALGCALWLPQAWPQAPGKPLRMILPMAPGSVGDTVARALAVHLSQAMARPVVIENLAGAGGMTGTAQLVRAPNDGLTLALVSSSHVINPFIFKAMPYDAIKDVTPISVLGKSMMALVTHPSLPAQTLGELLRLLRAEPGKFNYGSSGNGGVTHLPAELFNREAGVSTRHIPYKGLGQQVTDTVGGQVHFSFVPVGVAAPLVKAGKLRAIAVTGSARSGSLPEVPTFIEAGLSRYVYEPWLAIIGPAGLAWAQVQGIHGAIRMALEQPDIRTLMAAQDLTAVAMSPQETAAYFESELPKYGAMVKYAGATAE